MQCKRLATQKEATCSRKRWWRYVAGESNDLSKLGFPYNISKRFSVELYDGELV